MALRDPAYVDTDLVALVKRRSRPAEDAEIRAALAPLTPAEERVLRTALHSDIDAHPLGPAAWADIARGLEPRLAAARELSGYYTLQAERDALAAMVADREGEGKREPEPERLLEPTRARERSRAGKRERERERTGQLLGLFAYHRDAPLVARALGVSLSDLVAELESLKIRRKAFALTRGSDHDLPKASPVERARSGPPLRRRPAEKPAPKPSEKDQQSRALLNLLAEIGPRRAALAERLGETESTLLARFRAAGLEREFALRERDLIRALWSKHVASESRVAAELQATPADLRRIAAERGLARELDAERDRLRRDARRAKWPHPRLDQVLHRRDELRNLGVLEELDREVAARTAVIWKSLHGKRDALSLLAKKLHLTPADAGLLQRLLDLR
ncbi:MAG: hypothetical protein ABR567_23170 [Myxococcales bacterium]|nr:hypothetical protein [Myxococcales bacterium]